MNVALDVVSVLIFYLLLVTGNARHERTVELSATKIVIAKVGCVLEKSRGTKGGANSKHLIKLFAASVANMISKPTMQGRLAKSICELGGF